MLVLCGGALFAAQMRHFNMYVEASIPETQVVEHFSEWFNLPDNSTFVQSKVQTDDKGFTHYCYNQYVGGVPVEGGQVLVHAQNGWYSTRCQWNCFGSGKSSLPCHQ